MNLTRFENQSDSVDVSIIILTKDAGVNLPPLLERIFSQRFDGTYEVLAIDSGSKDDTLTVLRDFPVRLTEIKPEEFHHGKTRNLGAELANGRILVYITQDALPLRDDWLSRLTEDLKEPEVAMVVGRQIPWETTKPPERFFYFYYFPEYKLEIVGNAPDYHRDNMFISDVNSAMKREVWQIFKFSEKVVLAEDKEIAKRLLRTGWKIIYRPDAAVYHAHNLNLRSILQRSVDSGMALAQKVNVPRSKNWFIKRLGYFVKEAGYVATNKEWWKWLPYCAAYEASKLMGVTMGWIKGRFFVFCFHSETTNS